MTGGAARSDEEVLLRETAARVADDLFPPDTVRDAIKGPAGARHPAWDRLVDLGLVGLLVDVEHGGSGASTVSACIVAEELGRVLAPVPFVASAIAAAALLRHCGGTPADLRALAAGQPCAVLVDRSLRWPGNGVSRAVWGWVDGAAVLAPGSGGSVRRVDVAPARPDGSVDLLLPVLPTGDLPLSELPAPAVPVGEGARRAVATARVGCAAGLLGIARGAMTTAVAYAKEREQYGRPIGSFQAVQHLCADMLVDVETAHSAVYGAARVVEESSVAEAERVAASAKAWAGEAAVRVCETSIQVLGGIGVTWEHPAHLRLRAAHLQGAVLGGPGDCYELLAERALAGRAAR